MLQSHLGESFALLTAICWTVTSMFFESASKKVGSLSANLIRLVLAFVLIGLYTWISRGLFFPTDASTHNWMWLILSGLVGFVIGDMMLFEAFVVVGARISMLILSLTPPITAFIGWLVLDEVLTPRSFLGMFLTIFGIILVVIERKSNSKGDTKQNNNKLKLSYPIWGLLLAFGGAVGQGAGLVLSKYGMQDFDAFAATQIRVLAGIVGFSVLFIFMKRWKKVITATKNKKAMIRLGVGSFFGPFLGVSLSLLSVQYTTTGIASTIMAIVPVLIIPPAIIFLKEKISLKEIIGSLITIGGVAIFFM